MYLSHFGLARQPFATVPDPEFLYLSPRHGTALVHLRHGIEQRKNFTVLTGGVGCGKTILLKELLRHLPTAKYWQIVLKAPAPDAATLYRHVLQGLGEDPGSRSMLELAEEIEKALQRSEKAGQDVVLAIDEAQTYSPAMLEHVRLLSNLGPGLLTVLCGQPELRSLLRTKNLHQLRQRIGVYYHLGPLGLGDTGRYLRHRLRRAGGRVAISFLARLAIHRASGGVPRIINALGDRALLAAYVRDGHGVRLRDARRAIRDFRRL
ncbi:MAG: AAA family ATPase [Puniceicoccales bacterium]|jgi:general secretion pathway protein A|nr:AAA family ATPase [Puniceicoccales bacterium]